MWAENCHLQLTLLMATSMPLALCVPWYTCENCPEPSRSPSCRNRMWGGRGGQQHP